MVRRAVVLSLAGLWLLGLSGSSDARSLAVPKDFPTVQGAMTAARYGDTVLVGPGTYDGPIDLKNGVILQSTDGPEVTTLRGSRWWVVRIADADTLTALIGFTVAGGRAADRVVYCTGGGAPRILKNVIEKGWYGLSCEGPTPLIRDNVIRLNRQGVACQRSSARLVRNHITDNGKGVVLTDSNARLAGNRIDLNQMGVVLEEYSVPVIGGSVETANDILDNFAFDIQNLSMVKEEGIRTRIPALVEAEYNYWGNDCPNPQKFSGAVRYKPWMDAEHKKTITSCPK